MPKAAIHKARRCSKEHRRTCTYSLFTITYYFPKRTTRILAAPHKKTNAPRQSFFAPDCADFSCVTQSSAAKNPLVWNEKSSVCGAARKSPLESQRAFFIVFLRGPAFGAFFFVKFSKYPWRIRGWCGRRRSSRRRRCSPAPCARRRAGRGNRGWHAGARRGSC